MEKGGIRIFWFYGACLLTFLLFATILMIGGLIPNIFPPAGIVQGKTILGKLNGKT
jgi:hypothetical protein